MKADNKTLGIGLLIAGFIWYISKKGNSSGGNGNGGSNLTPAQQEVVATKLPWYTPFPPTASGMASFESAWRNWLTKAVDAYGSIAKLFEKDGPYYQANPQGLYVSIPPKVRAEFGWSTQSVIPK